MMYEFKYIVFLIFGLVSAVSWGQGLSLDSCLRLAVANNADIKNAELAVKEAEQTKKAALSKYFPTVSASAGAFHSDKSYIEYGISDISHDGLRNVLQNIYDIALKPFGISDHVDFLEKGVVTNVLAVQPIYAGGRIVTGNKLAKLGIEASTYQKQIAERDLLLDTEELYWQTKMLEEKLKTVNSVLVLLNNLDKDVRVALQAGLITENDGLRVKLKMNEMKSNAIKIENGIKLSKRALCQKIGMEFSDSICLTDTIGEVTSPWELKMDNTEAVQNRSEVKLLALNVKANQLQKRMIIGETLPQIGLGGSYMYNNLLEKNRTNLTGFATVSIPITAWGETAYNIKKQNYKIEEAQNMQSDVTAKLELQTQKIWDELDAAYRSYLLADQAVDDASSNLRLSTQYYTSGLISLSELLEAQTLYRNALDTRIEQSITYLVCLRHYKQITGQ